MVKELYLCPSTDALNDKAEDVYIDPKTDVTSLSRYVKSAELVFKSAETKRSSGDEELAYVYYMKYMHVCMQLRSTVAFKNTPAFEADMNKTLPPHMFEKAIESAEKLKRTLKKRYGRRAAALEKKREVEREVERKKIEAEQKLEELRLVEEEARNDSAVDATSLFLINNAADFSPLVPLGQSKKDLIPKDPHLSPIELMHIMESKMTVLLVDIRSLEEFKQSHVIHESVVFVSGDYLDINTKLTAAEVRELILFKQQRTLWDKRNAYDLIVIFDANSHINRVLEEPSHPINIIRDCTSDCLDPHFMTTDLPKVLDGGYENWVYHYPKHCTNPDRVKYLRKTASKTTMRKCVLPSTKDAQAPPIYPDLNPTITTPAVPTPTSVPTSMPNTSITSGNVQINMTQTPQTIQINQWSQPIKPQQVEDGNPYRQSKDTVPALFEHNTRGGAAVPALFAPSTDFTLYEKRGGLKITDVYNTPSATAPADTVASQLSDMEKYYQGGRGFSSKPSSTSHPTSAYQPTNYAAQPQPASSYSTQALKEPSSYTSFDGGYSNSTVLDMGGSPDMYKRSTPEPHRAVSPSQQIIRGQTSTTFPVLQPQQPSLPQPTPASHPHQSSLPQPTPASRPQQPILPQPPAQRPRPEPSPTLLSRPRPEPSPQLSRPRPQSTPAAAPPAQPKDTIYAELEPRRKLPTVAPVAPEVRSHTIYADIKTAKPSVDRTSKPPEPVVPEPAAPSPKPTTTVKNPSVNRTIKPLTAAEVQEKFLRMMPAHGAVQQGTCGLKNIGNTCFMNAVIQCLIATAPLSHYFLTDSYKKEINSDNPLGTQGLVAEEYAFLVKAMWADTYRHLAPKDWKNAIGRFRPQFLDYSQKDCQEFTVFMLDALHEDLNRVTSRPAHEELDTTNMPYKEAGNKSWAIYVKSNNSVIVDLFQGQYRSLIACMTCGNESVTFEPFMYLSVPVSKSKCTLKECIDAFCTVEQVSGDDKWLCTRCKKYRAATKSISIWKLPKILVIHLKRFSYTGMWRDKISTYVDFPLKDFVLTQGQSMTNPEEGKKYRLFGVTNHTGTLEGGHYIGCSRNPVTGDWFTYDDHVIRAMTASQTKKKEAYLLFYSSYTDNDDVRWIRESVLKNKSFR